MSGCSKTSSSICSSTFKNERRRRPPCRLSIFNREAKLQVWIQFDTAVLPYNWTPRSQCHRDQVMHRGQDCIQMSTHPYCVPLIVLRIVPRTIHKPITLTRRINQKFMFIVGPCPTSVLEKTKKTRCRVSLRSDDHFNILQLTSQIQYFPICTYR